MNALLQSAAVALLVAGCALFSLWRLSSLALRLRLLEALQHLPGVRGAWLARLRQATQEQLGNACGGCQAGGHTATPGAPSRNQTPGALRR